MAGRGTHTQQAGKLPTIGYLGDDVLSWSPWTSARYRLSLWPMVAARNYSVLKRQ